MYMYTHTLGESIMRIIQYIAYAFTCTYTRTHTHTHTAHGAGSSGDLRRHGEQLPLPRRLRLSLQVAEGEAGRMGFLRGPRTGELRSMAASHCPADQVTQDT